jgi:flagellar basal body L-ring protein FlgH
MIQSVLLRFTYACLGIMLLCGCQSTDSHQPLPNDPFYAPIMPETPRQKVTEDGSLFQSDMANSLYSDVKARQHIKRNRNSGQPHNWPRRECA